MNIVFAYPTEFNPQNGGIERVTDILARALLKNGYKIFYLNWKRNKDQYNYPAPIIDLPNPELNSLQNLDFYNDFLVKQKIDIVINQHGLYEGTYFLSQIKKAGIKGISVLHSNPLRNYSNLFSDIVTLKDTSKIEKIKRIARVFLYWRIKKAIHHTLVKHYTFIQEHPQYVCLLSDKYIDSLKKYCKIPDEYIVSIPNPNTYENVIRIPHKEPIVLFVGRLDNSSKKINTLINIWTKIKQQDFQWKLIIVGDGPDKEILYRKAKGIVNIKFVGRQDPRQYYERASIFCMTSIFEGFPMALTEAMQFGCVPIAFDSFPAVRDIIIPGKTGELVKPFNKKEYANKLIHLMSNENYRTQLSQKGFEYIKKFDISNILPKWIELIER